MSVSRRGFLTAASIGAGAVAASSLRAPLAGANPFDTGSLGTGSAAAVQDLMQSIPTGSGMIQPNGTLGHVGVKFPSFQEALGRIRFAFPDGSVGDWLPLELMDSAPDGNTVAASELVQAPTDAVAYEVDAPQGTEAVVYDDGRHGTPRDYSTGSIDTLGLPVISRAAWGAGDVAGMRWAPRFNAPQAITIHHTASDPGNDHAAHLRSTYHYHANVLGWGDIGYHLIIDPAGRIYQGRGGTTLGNAVFQAPPVAGIAPPVVTGGHVGGMNDGNIGISLLGNFEKYAPTEAAIRSTIDCVRRLSSVIGIHPHAGINYRGRPMPAVSGHRDWGGTVCPGRFFPHMNFIRDHAANGWVPGAISSAALPFGS